MARIVITGVGSISALGHDSATVREAYEAGTTRLTPITRGAHHVPGAPLTAAGEDCVARIRVERAAFEPLDRTVHLALHAARQAAAQAQLAGRVRRVGVALGSSRGATELLERSLELFYQGDGLKVPPLTSPTTTLGNLASWVAQDLHTQGPATELSSTCSSSLYALGQAVAWLRAGMSDAFIAGGTEAPLTPFTLAQMRSLRIYGADLQNPYPCRSCQQAPGNKNTMVLGEGAAVLVLERRDESPPEPPLPPVIADVCGVGFYVEQVATNTSLSADGDALFESMSQALADAGHPTIDLIITHTPGTAKGDAAELAAVRRCFGEGHPPLVSNKWLLGHTLGASGSLSLEYACLLLHGLRPVPYPYELAFTQRPFPPAPRTILVNSVGFGGNAGTFILGHRGP